tara:strand:+ start:915 stop:1436 length:522 start_codon:yes stop_codon:yes gene_type:complete
MIISKVKIVIVFLSMCLISCLKPESYPNEPILEYSGFESLSDSGKLTFFFTDGDGNIGLDQNLLSAPFDPGSFYYYNCYISYFELMDGQWVRATSDPQGNNSPFADSITYSYRIENMTPVGQDKALKGDIEIILEPFFYNPISNHSDSIRFSILLIDRSLNHSNLIFSPIIVP